MTFRKPELIPSLFIICATITLSTLGYWQVQRLQWKNALISQVEEAQKRPILGNLPQAIDTLSYQRVILTGRFLNDKTIRLVGGKQGVRHGFFILTPFVLEDDGRVILVNRGFAEKGKENPQDGIQHVGGILRPPREKRPFAPDNQIEKNLWFYEDMAVISNLTGSDLLPFVVEATGSDQRTQPIVSDGKIALRNDHLGYAVTWFSLAAIGLVMFAFYHRIPASKR